MIQLLIPQLASRHLHIVEQPQKHLQPLEKVVIKKEIYLLDLSLLLVLLVPLSVVPQRALGLGIQSLIQVVGKLQLLACLAACKLELSPLGLLEFVRVGFQLQDQPEQS